MNKRKFDEFLLSPRYKKLKGRFPRSAKKHRTIKKWAKRYMFDVSDLSDIFGSLLGQYVLESANRQSFARRVLLVQTDDDSRASAKEAICQGKEMDIITCLINSFMGLGANSSAQQKKDFQTLL